MTIVEMLMYHNVMGIVALFLVMIPVFKNSNHWRMWFTIYAIIQLLVQLSDLLNTAALI